MLFRSPLLKALPTKARTISGRPLSKRLLLVGIVIGLPALAAVLVYTRWAPVDGITHFLYQFHDHVFLPIKGQTYTRFFPWSLAWWGLAALLLIFGLISYLGSVPLLMGIHRNLVMHLTGIPVWWPFLLDSEKALIRFRAPSQQLLAAAKLHGQKALHNHLVGDRHADLAGTTLFHCQLIQLRDGHVPSWTALGICFDALLVAHQCHDQKPHQMEAVQQLTKLLSDLLDQHLPEHQETDYKENLHKSTGFESSCILTDLRHITALHSGPLAARLLGPEIEARPKAMKEAVLKRLALSSDARFHFLNEMRLPFEAVTTGRTWRYDTDPDFLDELPSSVEILRVIGRLATGLALERARLEGCSEGAENYLDALDALNLAMEMANGEQRPLSSSLIRLNHVLRGLSQQLPGPEHYRLCAKLTADQLHQQEIAWKKAGIWTSQPKEPTQSESFEGEQRRVESLLLAAGPDLDQPVLKELP